MSHSGIEQLDQIAAQQENVRQVNGVVGQLEAVAATRFRDDYGIAAPPGRLLTGRGLEANMLDSLTIHTVKRALYRYRQYGGGPSLLESTTRGLVDLYFEKSPRTEAEATRIASEGLRPPRFRLDQILLVRKSLIEMWANGEEDFQAAAQYVLVNSLFPGETNASHVLSQVETDSMEAVVHADPNVSGELAVGAMPMSPGTPAEASSSLSEIRR